MLKLLTFLTLAYVSFPADVQLPLKGGLSPHGKYEIRIIGRRLQSAGYSFGFFKPASKTLLFHAEVGEGFCDLAGASIIDTALWNENETLVAINDHGSRHSMEVYVLLVKENQALSIPLPEFGKAVSKRMEEENLRGGAESAWICTPLSWNKSKLVVQLMGGPFTSKITFRVFQSNPVHIELVSETPPEEIQP